MRVFSESAERLAFGPVVVAADGTVNGPTIDRRGSPFFRDLTFVLISTITDGSHTLIVQESANGTVWTDVTDVELITAQAASVSYTGSQPFVRMRVTSEDIPDPAGVGAVLAGIAILNSPRHRPIR